MKKWIFAGVIAAITVVLIAAGLLFGKDDNEKQHGLSGYYDISPDGTIAYVSYSDGKPGIYLYNSDGSMEMKALELENDRFIVDPSFSADGSKLFYISSYKKKDDKLESAVRQFDMETKEDHELFSESAAITEIEFSPDGDSLFYLQAGVFKNYSPIASERPHDFDLHEYTFADGNRNKLTKLKAYSMESLQVAEDSKSVYVHMPDDDEAETADDTFETNERIFRIPLDQPEDMKIVSDPDRKVDIYDFTVVPETKEFIFQSVSNPDTGGTFQYELFRYNPETKKEEQLTHLKEFTDSPVIGPNNHIYFMVDRKFAQKESDYHLYRMNMDGKEPTEVPLPESVE